jgi:hypothetical protein
MRGEKGQASVEWIGIVLVVALALAALARFAPSADGRSMASTVLQSVTCAVREGCERERSAGPSSSRHGAAGRVLVTAPPLVPSPHRIESRPPRRLPRELADRLRRGAGLAWRRAWLGCLTYERARYGFLHPESRFPGHTIGRSEALRMANDCISPVDLVRDWTLLTGR